MLIKRLKVSLLSGRQIGFESDRTNTQGLMTKFALVCLRMCKRCCFGTTKRKKSIFVVCCGAIFIAYSCGLRFKWGGGKWKCWLESDPQFDGFFPYFFWIYDLCHVNNCLCVTWFGVQQQVVIGCCQQVGMVCVFDVYSKETLKFWAIFRDCKFHSTFGSNWVVKIALI